MEAKENPKRITLNGNFMKLYYSVILSILLVMGLSSIHEIVEFTGSLILGPGDGFLFFGSGDLGSFDTEWDIINGFLGSFVGCLFASLIYRKK